MNKLQTRRAAFLLSAIFFGPAFAEQCPPLVCEPPVYDAASRTIVRDAVCPDDVTLADGTVCTPVITSIKPVCLKPAGQTCEGGPITWGQVFKQGDVPAGQTLALRLNWNGTIPPPTTPPPTDPIDPPTDPVDPPPPIDPPDPPPPPITPMANNCAEPAAHKNVLNVCKNNDCDYQTLAAASKNAKDNTLVLIHGDLYSDDATVWRQNNITLQGINGRPHLRANSVIDYQGGNDAANGKGIVVTRGDMRIENIEISGARVADANGGNGAAIRVDSGRLLLCGVELHDSQNGVLVNPGHDGVIIENSYLHHLGYCPPSGGGCSHGVYVNLGGPFVFRNSVCEGPLAAHCLKSRTDDNLIAYSIIAGNGERGSPLLDFPHGGKTKIVGSVIHHAANADSKWAIAYGAENMSNGSHLEAVNVTFVNDRNGGEFFRPTSGRPVVRNSLIVNASLGNVTEFDNVTTTSIASDYQLQAGSPAINAITNAVNKPDWQYVKWSRDLIERPIVDALDAGAFEFEGVSIPVPPPMPDPCEINPGSPKWCCDPFPDHPSCQTEPEPICDIAPGSEKCCEDDPSHASCTTVVPAYCQFDFNQDGAVDFADLFIMRDYFFLGDKEDNQCD